MLICAQSGRVSGIELKTDPASSERSSREGLKDNKNRLLGTVGKFSNPFGSETTISTCGGLDSDCTVVTLNRIAGFRVKNLMSDIERTWRDLILLVLRFILLVLTSFFCEKNRKQTGFRVKIVIL